MNHQQIQAALAAVHPTVPVFTTTVPLARLVRVDDLTDDRALLHFERTIVFVREVQASCRLIQTQLDSRSFSEPVFGDGQFCTALATALDWVEGQVHDDQRRADDHWEILMRVRDLPHLPLTGDLAPFQPPHTERPHRLAVPEHLWLHDQPDVLATCMAAMHTAQAFTQVWPWFGPREVIAESVVWSSADPSAVTLGAATPWLDAWRAALTPEAVVVPAALMCKPTGR